MNKLIYFIGFLFLSISSSSFAAIDALDFTSPQQEDDYHSLTKELRCPQCQNNNIADSNASIAVDMRAKVFELLQEGKKREDIIQYMVDRYGNFVTYNPPITIVTIFLWVVPALLVLLGIFFLFKRNKKMNLTEQDIIQKKQTQRLSIEEQQRLARLLKDQE